MLSKNSLKNISSIWIVPIVAVLIGVFLLYRHFSSIGETIYLQADSADSIVAGKTEIKYHSVTVGKIVKVSLSDNLEKVVLKAVMNREADKLLVEDSKLAIVKPRINSQGISGLSTLVSGVYIEIYPGKSKTKKKHYDLMDEIVTIGNTTAGVYVKLNDYSTKGNSLVGEPISYHGYQVGVIVESEFSLKSKRMEHRGFIYSPYDSLVNTNSKFWYSTALVMSFGPVGFDVRVASMDNFINGGVTFDVPKDMPPGKTVHSGDEFALYERETDVYNRKYSEFAEYAILMDGEAKTLETGTPVMHLGIQVGEVVDSNYDNQNLFEDPEKIMVPVIIRIDRERVDPELAMSFDEFRAKIDKSIDHGLSATVEAAGLIGSNMIVTLGYPDDNLPKQKHPDAFHDYRVIPNYTSGLGTIQKKLNLFLDNLNRLDLKSTNQKIDGMLSELTATIHELRGLASNLEKMTNDDSRNKVLQSISKTLLQLQKTLDSYSEHSEMYNDVTTLLSGIRDTLKNLNPVMQKTNEQPNRYIFGDDAGDERPKAGK